MKLCGGRHSPHNNSQFDCTSGGCTVDTGGYWILLPLL